MKDEKKNMGKDANAGMIYKLAKNLITERQLSGNRMGINDDLTNTNLISKNFSPLFIRKFNAVCGWPLYVSMIVDEDVSDIDQVVNDVIRACKDSEMINNNLQNMRNFTGILSETLINHYNNKKENCVEGVAILLAVDKAMIANLYGDYMNHTMCRSEWYSLLNMMPHI